MAEKEKKAGEESKVVWKKVKEMDHAFAGLGKKAFTVEEISLEDLLEIHSYQQLEMKLQAEHHLKNFWEFHIANNDKKPLTEKSQLGCRMRIKGDSIYLEWYWNYWVNGKDDKGKACRKPISKYISRGKGFSYPIKTLLKHSAPWEYDMVEQTEAALTLIRRQNHFLSLSRQNIREAQKSRETLDAMDGIATLDEERKAS